MPITERYLVTKPFDYLSKREYDFTSWSDDITIDVRRTDGSGIGTYIRKYQFDHAIRNGWLKKVK